MDYLGHVTDFLGSQGIEHEVMHHYPAYTAQEIADAQHVAGRTFVKSVIVKTNNKYVMCVLPAVYRVNFDELRIVLDTDDVHMATEEEIAVLFPDCEIGAEPPFVPNSEMRIYADEKLENNNEIVFNAGTHVDTVKMAFSDWKAIAHPQMVSIGVHV